MTFFASAPIAVLSKFGVTANETFVIPAGWGISRLIIANTTANAVTGGIRIGTTDGGADVVVAQPVGAGAIVFVEDATVLKKYFSDTVDQTLYAQAVVAWNSASLRFFFVIIRMV